MEVRCDALRDGSQCLQGVSGGLLHNMMTFGGPFPGVLHDLLHNCSTSVEIKTHENVISSHCADPMEAVHLKYNIARQVCLTAARASELTKGRIRVRVIPGPSGHLMEGPVKQPLPSLKQHNMYSLRRRCLPVYMHTAEDDRPNVGHR